MTGLNNRFCGVEKMILGRFSGAILGILCAIFTATAAATSQVALPDAIVAHDARGAVLARSGDVATLGAWLAPAPAQMVFEVRGSVSGFNYSATGHLSWLPLADGVQHAQHEAQHDKAPHAASYEARLQVHLPILGARSQSSQGRIHAQGLAPAVFIDRSRREHITTLDAQRGQAHFARNSSTAPIAPLTQDRVSVFFQLAGLLAADAPRWSAPGTTFTFATASRSSVQPWVFRVVGEQTLDLPAGRMAALMVERTRGPAAAGANPAQAGMSSAIWLAPELGYLPVRIRLLEDDGDMVDLRLQSLSR